MVAKYGLRGATSRSVWSACPRYVRFMFRVAGKILGTLNVDHDCKTSLVRISVALRLNLAPPYFFIPRPRTVDGGATVEARNAAAGKYTFGAKLGIARIDRQLRALAQIGIGRAAPAFPESQILVGTRRWT